MSVPHKNIFTRTTLSAQLMLRNTAKILVDHKLLLYMVLLVFAVASAVFYAVDRTNPLSANFLTGSIELLITVIIVDALLNLAEANDRNAKYVLLNMQTAEALRVVSALEVLQLGRLFNYQFSETEMSLTMTDSSNEELAKLVSNILDSNEFIKVVNAVRSDPKKAVTFFKKLNKLMENITKSQSDTLNKIKPYPNPEIENSIFNIRTKIAAHLKVVETMQEISEKVKKEHPEAEGSELFLKAVWIPLIDGSMHGDEFAFKAIIKTYFDHILLMHLRAQERDLHFEI